MTELQIECCAASDVQIRRQLLLQVMSCMLSSRTSSAASLPAYMHSK